ncbi:Spy/CpxP family protein refolding chaperone [Caulobacter hibisci]|uniref:Spy/CpxP family protein refolding chaperone n=1 Tax=Caulobacter hibisci TaxID=2035993 RepID=A0ABS0SV53_9CAUL|nr:Spy/CpxP family protein refolding chaperone [Caulobacter hibisci]MBI1683515.1 Spy/CpxP family protein refolding chaperone [Caulobacter hibisci]
MRPALKTLALAGAAALTAGVVAASAQTGQPPAPPVPPEAPQPPPPPGVDRLNFRGPPPMAIRAHRDPEARAKHLRDVLQLTDRQEGALKAYVAATGPKERPEPRPIKDDGPEAADKAPPTTLERLDRQAEQLAKVSAEFKARADATRAFYNALSPSQKKAFDILGPEVGGGPGVSVRRIETRGPGPRGFDGRGERRVIIERKSGS